MKNLRFFKEFTDDSAATSVSLSIQVLIGRQLTEPALTPSGNPE